MDLSDLGGGLYWAAVVVAGLLAWTLLAVLISYALCRLIKNRGW